MVFSKIEEEGKTWKAPVEFTVELRETSVSLRFLSDPEICTPKMRRILGIPTINSTAAGSYARRRPEHRDFILYGHDALKLSKTTQCVYSRKVVHEEI